MNRQPAKAIGNWWNRPCGIRELVIIALPLVISTASWSMTSFVDRVFLFWYSPSAMAAALPAGMLHFMVLCFPIGLASYLNVFVAQYDGAGQSERIGGVIRAGVRFGIYSVPLFLLFIPLAGMIFQATGTDPQVTAMETRYFQILAFGSGASVMATAMSCFYTGRGITRLVMLVEISSCLLNVMVDGVLIFGYLGPWLEGITGAGIATALSQWYKVAVYTVLLARAAQVDKFRLLGGGPVEVGLLGRIWRYGAANGVQVLLEVTTFTAFCFILRRLGTEALTATSLAIDVNALTFVPLIGIGIAVSTLVGREIGKGSPQTAEIATWSGLTVAVAYSGGMALAYWLIPDLFLMAHSLGMPPEEFAQLRGLVVVLLKFVALFCVFDATNLIIVSALKGAGDIRFVMLLSLLVSGLLILVAGIGLYLDWVGLHGVWALFTVWVFLLATIHLARFVAGYWKTMQVIDPA